MVGAVAHAIPKYEHPSYTGLTEQSVGVMVWADRGIRTDWPSIQLDLANMVQDDLQRSGADEVKGTSWPVQAASIVRYQRDHPEVEGMPITDVAPRLGVSRLIYIEVESFATRSEESLQMYRGSAAVTLQVIEIAPGGQAKAAYQEADIRAIYPPKSTPEGVLNASDPLIYRGIVGAMATEVVNHLTTHEVEGE